MEQMKIFDATAVIALLNEMDYPEGMVKLSKHYKVIIPKGVAGEIKKSPGRERLYDLVKQGAVQTEKYCKL